MATRNDFYKFRLDIQELNQKTEQYNYSWEEIAGIIFEAYPDIKKHRDKLFKKPVSSKHLRLRNWRRNMVGFKSDPLKLTKREQEVLDCLMDGLTYKQTAEKLCLSRYTMNTYRASIFQKKDVHSLPELIVNEYKKKLKEVTDGNN